MFAHTQKQREHEARSTYVLVRPVNLVLDARLFLMQFSEFGRKRRIDAELMLLGGRQIDRLLNHCLERREVGHQTLGETREEEMQGDKK